MHTNGFFTIRQQTVTHIIISLKLQYEGCINVYISTPNNTDQRNICQPRPVIVLAIFPKTGLATIILHEFVSNLKYL